MHTYYLHVQQEDIEINFYKSYNLRMIKEYNGYHPR